MKYMSKIFQPLIVTPKLAKIKHHDVTSKSQKLLSELGIVRPTSTAGCFSYLPLGIRSLTKLTALVEYRLSGLQAQRVSLPLLASEDLWGRSGRLDSSEELMRLQDRHCRKYILSPTHEELMTELVANISPVSSKQLPLRLYQIGSKFRDEMRPRFGTIRCREFLMKDLYTFDEDDKSAKHTYDLVGQVYDEIFQEIGVDFVKVRAASGTIGGSLSHEYHFPAAIGEDRLLQCQACGHKRSAELAEEEDRCEECGRSEGNIDIMGIEVGHTFLLGTRYSAPLSANLVSKEPLHMGCYGLGLSRIMAACAEALSTNTELRWPPSIAPYSLCIIGPKDGSKEFAVAAPLVEQMYGILSEGLPQLKNDIIVDDRTHMTIGKRILEAKRVGYPHILVIGQKATTETPEYELMDLARDKVDILNKTGIVQSLQEVFKNRSNKNYVDRMNENCNILMENILK